MNKILILVVVTFCFLVSFEFARAQTVKSTHQSRTDSVYKSWGDAGRFIITGKVKNSKVKFFEFSMTDYIENTSNSVIIKGDGTFEQSFPVVNSQQIYLYLNDDVITLTVAKQDTLHLEWDDKNFKNSFKIVSTSSTKNTLLQGELTLFNNFRAPFVALLKDLIKNKNIYTPAQKFELINNQYNEKIKAIITIEKQNPQLENLPFSKFEDLVVGEYFTYADILRQEKLLDFSLFIKEDESFRLPSREVTVQGKKRNFGRFPILDKKNAYRTANENYLTNVPSYRTFLYGYIRDKSILFSSYSNIVNYKMGDVIPKANFTDVYYHMGKSNFNTTFGATLLGDWFITKAIFNGFGQDEFDHVEMVYHKFLQECKLPYFKTILVQKYLAMKNLKPGLMAPAFSLEDENGKVVSLSDFAGKVIYIDFWGVSCGPCIFQFEEFTPKLHANYRDKGVVFLNICVDANKKEWMEGIKKYNVGGINLIAEGWANHPVAKAYNVLAIPHYVIVNRDGTIADNNAARPSDILGNPSKNAIDFAIEKR